MSTRCSQCGGTGFVQTSFGPKPCPSCHGKGFFADEVDEDENTDDSMRERKTKTRQEPMSQFSVILYSLIIGGVGFFIWPPLIIFGTFIAYIYFENFSR